LVSISNFIELNDDYTLEGRKEVGKSDDNDDKMRTQKGGRKEGRKPQPQTATNIPSPKLDEIEREVERRFL
jgi:hypothetical protein